MTIGIADAAAKTGSAEKSDRSGFVEANGARIWVERRGHGPDVLLIAGLSDSVEAWSFQLEGLSDRYRLTAFDNRGAGRTGVPQGPLSVEAIAEDAAAIIRKTDLERVHVAGFSAGSLVAQELALRHPELVRSLVLVSTWGQLDRYARSMTAFWRWMVSSAPSEREVLEAFYLWIYTPRAHADGTVKRFIDDVLAFPYPQPVEAFVEQLDRFVAYDSLDRLHRIGAPTLVLAGEVDICSRPALGRQVAEAIPDARFEVVAQQAHQPFQEIPEWFNDRVDAFWREVEDSESTAGRKASAATG
ncbi:MAG TPA: alpha/beta hydrolase [Actinomycetota bacterium]|nr:alpha/beta hydrolase [Actinomycetota bacterium]